MDHPEGASSDRGVIGSISTRVRPGVPGVRRQFGRRLAGDARASMTRFGLFGPLGVRGATRINRHRQETTVHPARRACSASVFGRLAGSRTSTDADRLARSIPWMGQVVGGRAVGYTGCLSLAGWGGSRPETLALAENRAGAGRPERAMIGTAFSRTATGLKYIVLDMDSSSAPPMGHQEGSAWNGGILTCNLLSPELSLFNQFRHCCWNACALRNGNVHKRWTAWRDVPRSSHRPLPLGRDPGGRFFPRRRRLCESPRFYARL